MYIKKFLRKRFITVFLIFFMIISTIQTIQGLPSEKSELNTAIRGIYYLRDDDPLDWADIGSLLKSQSIENETTCCGMFINFHFAEAGLYIGNCTINNIYYHFWQKGFLTGEYEVGYGTSEEHTAGFNESFFVDINNYICDVNNFRLIQAMQYTNPEIAIFKDDDIYNFTIKLFGPNPKVICNPNQHSFVILNLEDNSTLKTYDRDDDLFNDFDELFVYFTNPYDSDTDNDGYSDYIEKKFGSNPNDFSDNLGINTNPNTPTIYGPISGKVGKKYEYIFSSSDPELNNVSYYINWGDDQRDKWIGPYFSGEEITISHKWTEPGNYIIKAKTKDIYGAESDWSELQVTMPRGKIPINSFFIKLIERYPQAFSFVRYIIGL